MKQFTSGLVMGALVITAVLLFAGSSPAQDDSIKIYLDRMESLLREEIARNITSGRFQLQSFSIERTHWHYMLDTTTGKLHRMELGRTPDRSDWILMANGMVDRD